MLIVTWNVVNISLCVKHEVLNNCAKMRAVNQVRVLLLLLYYLRGCCCTEDYYTSIVGLQKLAKVEQQIVSALTSYVTSLEERLNLAKRYVFIGSVFSHLT